MTELFQDILARSVCMYAHVAVEFFGLLCVCLKPRNQILSVGIHPVLRQVFVLDLCLSKLLDAIPSLQILAWKYIN